MQAGSTLVKTPKGVEEIEKRTFKLAGRLRAVLFIIDGQRTVGDLLDQAGSLADQTQAQLDELAAQGFIREIEPVVEIVEPPQPKPVKSEKSAALSATIPPRQSTTQPLPAKPPAVASALPPLPPSPPPPAPPKVDEPLETVKERVRKMLSETMGMRAMFLGNELSSLSSKADMERFIDDVARSMATTSGPKQAELWRNNARALAGF
jgi:hypothetical protein